MTIIEQNDKYRYKVGISEKDNTKLFHSENANYIFDMTSGLMCSWGKNMNMDPEAFPAPNILDMEVTTSCSHRCPFCYKSNNPNGKNMTFETFKKIFDVLPKSLTQIAFGADYDLSSNPDIWKMMEYARENKVIPNVTAGYVSEETADKLAKYCGAVAISRYESKDKCYDSIKRLTDRGMTQINMHYMISEETFDRCIETLEDIHTDERLSKLNAIVMLSLKQKGRGVNYHILSQEKFNQICDKAREYSIGLGFDSCSSLKAYRAFKDKPEIRNSIIPCEAARESSYINVDGYYYPCSFCEGEGEWSEGLNVLECQNVEDFLDKIWYNAKTTKFCAMLSLTEDDNTEKCRHCPIFNV